MIQNQMELYSYETQIAITFLCKTNIFLKGDFKMFIKNSFGKTDDGKEVFIFESLRKCEKFTGVDRHRIKTFLRSERPNYTKYIFKLIDNK